MAKGILHLSRRALVVEEYSLIQSRKEKVFAPHHALVNAQPSALMIHAMFEDAFPARRLNCQELRLCECVQDVECSVPIQARPAWVARQFGQVPHAASSDGRSRAFIGQSRIWLVPVVGGYAVFRSALDVKVGASLGRL